MRGIVRFFHHLFNPHCEHCEDELRCESCDILRAQLEIERHEKKIILQSLLDITNPKVTRVETEPREPIAIGPRHTPWRVRQQQLEEEDRAKASAIRKHNDELREANEYAERNKTVHEAEQTQPQISEDKTEELEKELGIA